MKLIQSRTEPFARIARRAAVVVSALLVPGGGSLASAATPAVSLVSGTPMDPASALPAYDAGTTHANGAAAWASRPREIRALARTLSRGGAVTGVRPRLIERNP